ncbi:MAG: fatty acid hydroxylase family protein [Gammaproteobacteria bacterium]|nr:MAG: fatty acid hydroxylase family protein [Gammaproteobacteria bacterium]
MREFVLNCSALEIMGVGLVFFIASYLLFGAVNTLFTRKILPAMQMGKPLDLRSLSAGQYRREIQLSAVTVFIFGAGVIFPWGLLQLGWASLAVDPSLSQILMEMLVLIIWNEVHFYINHRLLHTKLLQRFHLPHHGSIVTTPWTAYSFHPVEALMLGSVLMLPMVLHDFSIHALIFIPLFSLLINTLGHANYDINPASRFFIYQGMRRHQLHHALFNGNYGFMLPFMDKLCGTALQKNSDESVTR